MFCLLIIHGYNKIKYFFLFISCLLSLKLCPSRRPHSPNLTLIAFSSSREQSYFDLQQVVAMDLQQAVTSIPFSAPCFSSSSSPSKWMQQAGFVFAAGRVRRVSKGGPSNNKQLCQKIGLLSTGMSYEIVIIPFHAF